MGSLYAGIANYKGFKESTQELVQDAQYLSSTFSDSFFKENGVPANTVYRTERRAKTPGKILRAITQLESIETSKELPIHLQERVGKIKKLLLEAEEDLSPEDRQTLGRVLKEKHGPSSQLDLFPRAVIRPKDSLRSEESPELVCEGDSRHVYFDRFRLQAVNGPARLSEQK